MSTTAELNPIERHKTIVESFNPELRKVFEWVQEWKTRETSRGLRARYELGQYVRKVMDDEEENNGSLYGQRAIDRLSEAMTEDVSMIRAAVRFVKAYTEEQLETICALTRPDGEPISWSHIRLLVGITDPTQREELLSRCVANCWTSIQLGNEIGILLNRAKPEKQTKGRPVSAPKSLNGLIDQVGHFAEEINKRSKNWNNPTHSPTAMLNAMPPDAKNDSLLAKMIEKRDELNTAIMNMKMQERELNTAIARLQRQLHEQKAMESRVESARESGELEENDNDNSYTDEVIDATDHELIDA